MLSFISEAIEKPNSGHISSVQGMKKKTFTSVTLLKGAKAMGLHGFINPLLDGLRGQLLFQLIQKLPFHKKWFEEEFDGEISDEDAQSITTVGEAIDYINKNMTNWGQ